MKNKLIAMAILIAFAVGCTSFVNNVQNTRATAIDVAYAGYTTWTNYYITKTNSATITPAERASLDQAAVVVKQSRLKFAATVGVLDGWVAAYSTNSSVKPQLQSVLDATVSSASNVVWLISFFRGQ